MKISKLLPNSIFASKAKDEKITLFLNKATNLVSYKDEENNVIAIGAPYDSGILTETVVVTSAELNEWGQDNNKFITLIQGLPSKFINVISIKVRETGTPSQDYIDNWEGATVAEKYQMAYAGDLEYYMLIQGTDGSGAIVSTLSIDPGNNIGISKEGNAYNAGTLEYSFEIEYKLVDIS